jgi:hypothetical protein
VHEAILPNAPPPRGKDINLWMFINSDHASDNLTWQSCTGFLIYLNMAPIVWHSKKQATIETSVFGGCWVHRNEARHGSSASLALQATNDGSKCLCTFLYLWGQYVCDT